MLFYYSFVGYVYYFLDYCCFIDVEVVGIVKYGGECCCVVVVIGVLVYYVVIVFFLYVFYVMYVGGIVG